ncbi:MAG: peptide ABC transporter substrate-binding protein [Anaerolineae bacterium]|nr:peptide ABC transporter substrate-binding protein [Anaerolineae bacterium]
MLKGLRWPLAVLVLASVLLVLALATQPDKESESDPPPATTTPAPPSDTSTDPPPQPEPESDTQTTPLPTADMPLTPDNVLVEGLVGEIRKLNPLLAVYNPVDRDIVSLIFEGLTATNDYGEIIPDLAESWTLSADGLQYIFMLRDDVLWQDGMPFTADDVVFTMELMSDPQFPGPVALHEFWRTVEVDALDERTVRFRLTQPLASFVDQLRIGILPVHVLEGVVVSELGQHPFNLDPIGTGPYQIEALTASNGQIDGIQLRVAPVYRQRPEGADGYLLDRVVFRTYPTPQAALDAYRQGEVNSISFIAPDQQAVAGQIPGLSLYTAVEPHVGVLIYNWQREAIRFVRNPRVRLALAHAVDREGLVTAHLSGRAVVADSPLLPGSWAYESDTAWPVYDMALAQAAWDNANLVFDEVPPEAEATEGAGEPAGEPDTGAEEPAEGPAGEESPAEDEATSGEGEPSAEATEEPTPEPEALLRLALTILTLDDPALVALCDEVAASWEQLGLSVSVEAVDAEALQARLEDGDFDAALVELSFEPNADPDPFIFWHQGQYQTGQNYGGMDDQRISEALEFARRDATGIHRQIYYRRFQALFAERAPALVLYYPLYIYAADSRLAGVQLGFLSSPSDRFRHIQEWAFER